MDGGITFGFQISAADRVGTDDAGMYRSLLREAQAGYDLGYDIAWLVEHHFSDYFPQPGPLTILSHIAARCPGLGLGAMVLVLPWHQPLRLAGEIAVLSHLSEGDLHLGLGRGNAPLEYEAFDVSMAQAKDRFSETWRILELAMTGEPFTFAGDHLRVPRRVRIRPRPLRDKIHFYGAIGNPASAAKIAELGLAPISNGTLAFDTQKEVLATWSEVTRRRGGRIDAAKPVSIICIIADSDREAIETARTYIPHWYELQTIHYAFDAERHRDLPDYRPFAETHARRVHMTDPDHLGPLIEVSLIGSPATVARKLEQYVDLGFDSFVLQSALPGIPDALRVEWLTRFAHEVAPQFAPRFAERRPRSAREFAG